MNIRNFRSQQDSFEVLSMEDLYKFCNKEYDIPVKVKTIFYDIDDRIYIVLSENLFMYYKENERKE